MIQTIHPVSKKQMKEYKIVPMSIKELKDEIEVNDSFETIAEGIQRNCESKKWFSPL